MLRIFAGASCKIGFKKCLFFKQMKKIFYICLVVIINLQNSFSQIDDFLKKIPGVGDVFEEAVTTSIKDAYPSAYWLNNAGQAD